VLIHRMPFFCNSLPLLGLAKRYVSNIGKKLYF
jgi:hypothetical protein